MVERSPDLHICWEGASGPASLYSVFCTPHGKSSCKHVCESLVKIPIPRILDIIGSSLVTVHITFQLIESRSVDSLLLLMEVLGSTGLQQNLVLPVIFSLTLFQTLKFSQLWYYFYVWEDYGYLWWHRQWRPISCQERCSTTRERGMLGTLCHIFS